MANLVVVDHCSQLEDFILSFSFYGFKKVGQSSVSSGINWATTKTKGIEEEAGGKELEDREDYMEKKRLLADFRLCEKGSQLYQIGKYIPLSGYLV